MSMTKPTEIIAKVNPDMTDLTRAIEDFTAASDAMTVTTAMHADAIREALAAVVAQPEGADQ